MDGNIFRKNYESEDEGFKVNQIYWIVKKQEYICCRIFIR